MKVLHSNSTIMHIWCITFCRVFLYWGQTQRLPCRQWFGHGAARRCRRLCRWASTGHARNAQQEKHDGQKYHLQDSPGKAPRLYSDTCIRLGCLGYWKLNILLPGLTSYRVGCMPRYAKIHARNASTISNTTHLHFRHTWSICDTNVNIDSSHWFHNYSRAPWLFYKRVWYAIYISCTSCAWLNMYVACLYDGYIYSQLLMISTFCLHQFPIYFIISLWSTIHDISSLF